MFGFSKKQRELEELEASLKSRENSVSKREKSVDTLIKAAEDKIKTANIQAAAILRNAESKKSIADYEAGRIVKQATSASEKILEDARNKSKSFDKDKEAILNKAKQESNSILSSAYSTKEQMVQLAKQESDSMLKSAKKEADAILEDVYKRQSTLSYEVRKALEEAQKTADETIELAKKEAESLIFHANNTADGIVMRHANLSEEIKKVLEEAQKEANKLLQDAVELLETSRKEATELLESEKARIKQEVEEYKSNLYSKTRDNKEHLAKQREEIQFLESKITKLSSLYNSRCIEVDKDVKSYKLDEKNKVKKEVNRYKEDLQREAERGLGKKEKQIQELNLTIAKKNQTLTNLKGEINQKIREKKEIEESIDSLEDALHLSELGFFESSYPDISSTDLYTRLKVNQSNQKALMGSKQAIVAEKIWRVEGSETKGRQMIERQIKLALRAFNGECSDIKAKVSWSNKEKLQKRVNDSNNAINKLLSGMYIKITSEFLKLKLEEVDLLWEAKYKEYQEKEEQRIIKERMREEEKARKDFEKALQEAERQEMIHNQVVSDLESKYEERMKALAESSQQQEMAYTIESKKLKAMLDKAKFELEQALQKKERAKSMAEQTKCGYVYVISNTRSFGKDKYKIGLTRRLDPLDRVKELSGASVPFPFDVHAMIYTEDAPALEHEMHEHFDDKRWNKENKRKEFFMVSLEEIEQAFVSKGYEKDNFKRTLMAA